MAWNPVETVDYIFDRYGFLGLVPEASVKEIRAAIKTKRIENHPDRLVKVGSEAKEAAETVLKRTDECADVLLNKNRKAYFDAKLAWFKEHRPQLISRHGTPMISFDVQHFELPVLMGQADGGKAEAVKEQARQLTNFNPERTAKLRRMHEASGDADVREMLVEALHSELLYYDAMEEDAWQQAGISGKKHKMQGHLFDPTNYAEMSAQELDRMIEEELPVMLGETFGLNLLGMATPLLLLTGPDKPAGLPARREDLTAEHLMAQAKTVLDGRRGMLREAAERKQAVLVELAALHDIRWLTDLPRRRGAFTIMLMHARNDGEEPVAVAAFECHDDATHLHNDDEHPGLGHTAATIMGLSLAKDTLAIGIDQCAGQPLMMLAPAVRFRKEEMARAA